MASVHVEFSHRRGWLTADRILDAGTYEALLSRARQWAGEDRVWADVLAEFGPPLVHLGGGTPLYGKTLAYVSEDPERPPAYPEPLLWAVRFGDGPFRDTFTFTPQGRRLQPSS